MFEMSEISLQFTRQEGSVNLHDALSPFEKKLIQRRMELQMVTQDNAT